MTADWWEPVQQGTGPRPYVGIDEPGGGHIPAADAAPASGVRPYLITQGRSGPNDARLRLEAQVCTTADGILSLNRLAYERHAIVTLCREPQSVAELAARLHIHLGVARVLVGDLVEDGVLAVRHPEDTQHRIQIIERVIRGLQAIT
ncbi:DUF742 domain-containing protein [Catellatospora citrea]|uniref:DUF742 domain-containing protein n=1 Tax=Catellatospora citrea TaxID=53366 RepID=A0A8J3KDG1_9ACTN|nr:DUF742 domain-containing protein [Catellatospora citrea]RKE10684.1 uncharacterized protein DUF742 [Catellatospora citrea]GIG01182.1 hypothetical protein Cci01nite_62750 [Catellatospora citrea]